MEKDKDLQLLKEIHRVEPPAYLLQQIERKLERDYLPLVWKVAAAIAIFITLSINALVIWENAELMDRPAYSDNYLSTIKTNQIYE